MTAEEFEKSHAYNIRHSYGREGKKTDYTPQSCSTVMGKMPSTGEYHGCIFRHMDETNLRKFIEKYRIYKE